MTLEEAMQRTGFCQDDHMALVVLRAEIRRLNRLVEERDKLMVAGNSPTLAPYCERCKGWHEHCPYRPASVPLDWTAVPEQQRPSITFNAGTLKEVIRLGPEGRFFFKGEEVETGEGARDAFLWFIEQMKAANSEIQEGNDG